MNVLIIGASGKIGSILTKKLKGTPHQPIAMVRNEAQVKPLEDQGINTVLADLEKSFDHAFEGVNAVVFTAGSGAHTGQDKTHLIDRIGAKKAIDLAIKYKVDRFIMVSALGADSPSQEWPKAMAHYYEAKADADKHLMQSPLNYTILRPGRLTDENGTNNIVLAEHLSNKEGTITRTDVATVIQKVLDLDQTFGKALDFLNGETPIDKALDNL